MIAIRNLSLISLTLFICVHGAAADNIFDQIKRRLFGSMNPVCKQIDELLASKLAGESDTEAKLCVASGFFEANKQTIGREEAEIWRDFIGLASVSDGNICEETSRSLLERNLKSSGLDTTTKAQRGPKSVVQSVVWGVALAHAEKCSQLIQGQFDQARDSFDPTSLEFVETIGALMGDEQTRHKIMDHFDPLGYGARAFKLQLSWESDLTISRLIKQAAVRVIKSQNEPNSGHLSMYRELVPRWPIICRSFASSFDGIYKNVLFDATIENSMARFSDQLRRSWVTLITCKELLNRDEHMITEQLKMR